MTLVKLSRREAMQIAIDKTKQHLSTQAREFAHQESELSTQLAKAGERRKNLIVADTLAANAEVISALKALEKYGIEYTVYFNPDPFQAEQTADGTRGRTGKPQLEIQIRMAPLAAVETNQELGKIAQEMEDLNAQIKEINDKAKTLRQRAHALDQHSFFRHAAINLPPEAETHLAALRTMITTLAEKMTGEEQT